MSDDDIAVDCVILFKENAKFQDCHIGKLANFLVAEKLNQLKLFSTIGTK
jgi:hypothetical protein